MADKKISQLTAGTTPLAGTEVLPIVQGGTTKNVSVNNLTAGKSVSVGNLISGGSVQIGSGGPYATGTMYADANWGMLLTSATNNPLNSDFGWLRYDGTLLAKITNDNLHVSLGNLVVGTAGKGIDFSANTHAAGMTSELLDWYEEGTWTGTLTAATPPTTPITKTGRYTRIGNQITIAIEFDNVDTSGAAGAMEVTGLPFAATAAGYGPVMKSGIGTDVIMAGVYGGLSKVIFSDAGTMSTTNIVAAAGVYLRFSATYYV